MAKKISKAGLEMWRQRLYDRCDGLDEACSNLKWAAEALEGTCHLDEQGLLEDMREKLLWELGDVRRLLGRLENATVAVMAREFQRSSY